MPALRNKRWEAFAQELAKGSAKSEAARAVGYAVKHSPSTGCNLAKRPEIQQRVEELSVINKAKVNQRLANGALKVERRLKELSAMVRDHVDEVMGWSIAVDRAWTIAMLVRNAEEARKDKQYTVVRQSVMDAAKVAKVYVERSEQTVKFDPSGMSDEELERLQEFLEKSVPPEIVEQNRRRLLAASEMVIPVEAEPETPEW